MEKPALIYDIINNLGDGGVTVTIGSENTHPNMKDSSIVTATYHIGDRVIGTIGSIGPHANGIFKGVFSYGLYG